MENKLQIFNHAEFGNIRTIEEAGKLLFCGKDIAQALAYDQPRKAIASFCPHGVKHTIGVQTGTKADGTPAMQMVETTFIPEGDVYRLITRSKLPAAEKFERWVFDEVVPSVVSTGSYGTSDNFSLCKMAEVVDRLAAVVEQLGLTAMHLAQTTSNIAATNVSQTEPKPNADIESLFEEDAFLRSNCKLERAPAYIREPVDKMFHQMLYRQRLNFSAIVRFCLENGFQISNPAVRRYYDRVICAQVD